MPESARAFARQQLDDVEPLVALMAARLTLQIPALAKVPTELKVEMIDYLRQLAVAALETVVRGEPLEALVGMIESTARRRRAQGVPLEQALQMYDVAQQALLDSVSQQLAGHPHEANVFSQVTRLLLDFQRVTTLGVTAAFNESPEQQSRDRDHDVQALLEILLGRRSAADGTHGLATRLGIDQPLTLLTVSVPLGIGAADTARAVARAHPWGVVGHLDGRVVALTVRAPTSFPAPCGTVWVPDSRPVAPSTGEADLEDGVVRTMQRALSMGSRAADVAAALAVDRLCAEDAAPLAAMLALPDGERKAYVYGCFQTLPDTTRGRALLSAVSAAMTYPRQGEAAKALHVHRHTLDYRLRRFGEETGLDLADPATRFRCMVALFLIGQMPYRAAAS